MTRFGSIFIFQFFLTITFAENSSRPYYQNIQHEFIERGCQGQLVGILIGKSGFISSRNFKTDGTNSTYPDNEHCQWMIKASPGSQIRLRFTDFGVEPGKNCIYDNVTIWQVEGANSRKLLGTHCGNKLPPITEAKPDASVLVVFQSDESLSSSGFRLLWETFSPDDPLEQACHVADNEYVTLNGAQGVIQLSNFDGKTPYSPNLHCAWKIHMQAGKMIRAVLQHFDVEDSKDCAFDSLKVFDGGLPLSSTRLGRFCGKRKPFLLTSSSNELLINFRSDGSNEMTGFQLKWYEVLPNSFAELGCRSPQPAMVRGTRQGEIHLPGFDGTTSYEANLNCKWLISVSNSSTINLNLTHLSIEFEAKSCLHDSLTLSHPSGKVATKHLCGFDLPKQEITWPNSEMLVEFKSDDSIESTGFRIEWSSHEATFDEQIQHIPAVKVEPQQKTNVSVVLPARPKTRKITEENLKNQISSGQENPQHYSCQTPRRYYYSRAGMLASPGYGLAYYPESAHCSYVITVPSGHHVRLNFTTFEIEYSDDCENDYVAIYEGDSEQNKTIAKLCGILDPGKTVESSGNRILVVFHSNNRSNYKGFSARFNAVREPNYANAGCWWGEENPAEVTASSGILTSRNFDGYSPYPYNQRCAWHIVTNVTSRISIRFSHFALESSSNGCSGDTLSVYDGSSKNSPLLGVFCGVAIPPPILSSGRHLFITFSTDDRNQKTGFRLEWSSVPLTAISKNQSSKIIQASWPGPGMSHPKPVYSVKPRKLPAQPGVDMVKRVKGRSSSFRQVTSNSVYQPVKEAFQVDPQRQQSRNRKLALKQHLIAQRLPNAVPMSNPNLVPPMKPFVIPRSNVAYQPKVEPIPRAAKPSNKAFFSNQLTNVFGSSNDGSNMPVVHQRPEVKSTQKPTTRLPTTVSTTKKPVTDECLAGFAETNVDSAVSSFYGTCDNGKTKVLTSRKALDRGGIVTTGNFNYKFMYPMLQNCVWSIQVPPGYRVTVDFVHFDLERGRNKDCPYDRLEMWDGATIPDENDLASEDNQRFNGSRKLGEFCGSLPQHKQIVSTRSSLTMRFVSDSVVQKSGFCLKWTATPVERDLLIAEEVGGHSSETGSSLMSGEPGNEPSGCGGPKYLKQGSGHIKSPNYGLIPYQPNLQCSWVISAPAGKIVRINLIDVDIEPDVSCRYDFLALHDGASEYADMIKRLCGRPRPNILKTSSNTVYLQFKSDATAEGRGFLIEYSFTDPPTK